MNLLFWGLQNKSKVEDITLERAMGNSILTAHSNSHATSCTERALTTKMNADRAMDKTIRMNPSWTRILIILLYLRHFFTSQISTRLRPSWPKYQPISEPETPHVITSFQSSRFIIHGQKLLDVKEYTNVEGPTNCKAATSTTRQCNNNDNNNNIKERLVWSG